MVRKTRWHILLTLLLLAFAATASAKEPITVETRLVLDGLPDQDLVLVGLASGDGGHPTLLRVAWGRGASLWFPVWQLSVGSEQGLFGSDGAWALPQVIPQPGHTYRAVLSYDPARGMVALRVTDETTGEVVVRRGVQVPPYDGPVEVAHLADAVVERVARGYEPVDLRWELGKEQHGGFVVLQSLEPAEPVQVRVHAQGPLPGEFRLILPEDTGERTVVSSATWAGESMLLTIPPETLPIGLTPLTLQYVEDGSVGYSETRTVQVGRAAGAVRARYDRESNTVRTRINLASSSNLWGLTLDVAATVSRMEWDAEARNYRYIPVSEHRARLDDVDLTPSGTQLEVQLPAPAEAGGWKLDVSVTAEPNVALHLLPGVAYVSTYDPPEPAPGDELTVAILPDTQYYAKSYPEVYMRMAEWLAQNAADEGIAFALHVGDITDDNARDQWQAARDAHSLLDGVLPYVLSVGNHDYAASGLVADRGTTLVNEYWSVEDFPHLAGTMHEGRIENAYYELLVGDEKYLIVALEFAPSDAALEWANRVVAAHPEHAVMVATHTYLHPSAQLMASGRSAEAFPLGTNPSTTMNDGADIWAKFVRKHPNIVFVVNGHIHSDAVPYRVSVGEHGNRVLQMLFDFQAGPMGGEGYIGLVRFHADGRVTARAYSPYLDEEKRGFDAYGNVVPVQIMMGW